ncbi:kininogen-1 [Emydura macquarii macquarii]|uniref:kininogen-1 n=1 Tax=Emydura macquarii macquarii TaxID=1129001 RepID=UPI00352A59E8
MKLSAVLVLCCSFFSSSASPLPTQDADCDDPDVFEAVEIALRKYNGDKTDGNQFALYMVMEAKRTTGPGIQFFVKYRIRESSCAVGGDKLWQDCDYRASAEAESGECTAQVDIDKAEKISSVTQECKIIPVEGKVTVSHAACLGCFHPIPGDSLQLLPILRYAIQIFNSQSDQSSLFDLGEIIKATRQVVAGWNYAIEYEVKETNCSKNNFQDLSPVCKPIFGGHVGRCDAKAYVDLSDTIVDVVQKCKFPVEETVIPLTPICAGCPRPIPTNSTELEEPLRASLEKYNEDSNDGFYYKAEAILYATVQVVAGKNYNITFIIRKTNCSKSDVKKLNEDCKATIDSEPLQCTAQVYVVPWTKTIQPNVNCKIQETILARRPPGLTPFRSLFMEAKTTQTTPQNKNEKGPREGQAPGKGPGKDIRCGPKHGGEDKHGHRHDIGCGPECEHRQGPGHEHKHGHRRGPEHEHEEKHGGGHGHGHGKHKDKQKEIKGKHKYSKDESSEECHDEVANQKERLRTQSLKPGLVEVGALPIPQPTKDLTDGFPEFPDLPAEIPDLPAEIPDLPAEPDSTGIIPDILSFGGLPDLPEPSVPKCPGKPWKPITDFTTATSKPKVLTNEDLLAHVSEDTNPITESYRPPSQDLTDFDLKDLLP